MLLVSEINESKKILNQDNNLSGLDKLSSVRSEIPAVTHVDFSARIQTVSKETNTDYYELIKEFFILTGCPVIVNTSFNVRGEPIVHSPKDAFKCFMGTNLDMLVLENFILKKEDQDKKLLASYFNKYDLD